MVQAPPKPLTLAEFLQLPETKPARDYLAGEISQKPMPKGKHALLQTQLVMRLNAQLQAAQVAWAFTELRCTFGKHSLVPDIAVFTWPRLPRDATGELANDFLIAPDWAIEILSPGQSQTQLTKKILSYLVHETQMGWLIDPREHTVFIYSATAPVQWVEAPEQILAVPGFAAAVELTAGELFGWLQF